jgi:hypothetical protein
VGWEQTYGIKVSNVHDVNTVRKRWVGDIAGDKRDPRAGRRSSSPADCVDLRWTKPAKKREAPGHSSASDTRRDGWKRSHADGELHVVCVRPVGPWSWADVWVGPDGRMSAAVAMGGDGGRW